MEGGAKVVEAVFLVVRREGGGWILGEDVDLEQVAQGVPVLGPVEAAPGLHRSDSNAGLSEESLSEESLSEERRWGVQGLRPG